MTINLQLNKNLNKDFKWKNINFFSYFSLCIVILTFFLFSIKSFYYKTTLSNSPLPCCGGIGSHKSSCSILTERDDLKNNIKKLFAIILSVITLIFIIKSIFTDRKDLLNLANLQKKLFLAYDIIFKLILLIVISIILSFQVFTYFSSIKINFNYKYYLLCLGELILISLFLFNISFFNVLKVIASKLGGFIDFLKKKSF